MNKSKNTSKITSWTKINNIRFWDKMLYLILLKITWSRRIKKNHLSLMVWRKMFVMHQIYHWTINMKNNFLRRVNEMKNITKNSAFHHVINSKKRLTKMPLDGHQNRVWNHYYIKQIFRHKNNLLNFNFSSVVLSSSQWKNLLSSTSLIHQISANVRRGQNSFQLHRNLIHCC